MEFLILVVLFLIALGFEKEPQSENVYVAKRVTRREGRRGVAPAVRRKRIYRGA